MRGVARGLSFGKLTDFSVRASTPWRTSLLTAIGWSSPYASSVIATSFVMLAIMVGVPDRTSNLEKLTP